ncbi:MAG: hypothetical protein SAL07_00265 [Oscillatoria sp. PMC 1051.18]|nr:hypothetical protein [Oscillatoria sp. PMC 1050.18]MEC5028319.1 hypothetical protein [Oscillatoria sp. PMC 1051.18]
MSVLYQDDYIVCDDDGITINFYYFPVGSKRILYSDIISYREDYRNFFPSSGRIWGMGFTPEWFNLDPKRFWKTKYITIEEKNNWVKSVITPDNGEAVIAILREKVS